MLSDLSVYNNIQMYHINGALLLFKGTVVLSAIGDELFYILKFEYKNDEEKFVRDFRWTGDGGRGGTSVAFPIS